MFSPTEVRSHELSLVEFSYVDSVMFGQACETDDYIDIEDETELDFD